MPPLTTSSALQWAWAAADRRFQAHWWWRTRPEPPKPALLLLLPHASRRGHEQVAATRVPLARAARARQEVVDVVSEGGGALSRAYLQGAAKAVEAAMGAAAADTVGPEASDTMRLSYADRRLVVCRVLPGNAAPGDGASSEAASSKVATAPAGAVGAAADTLTPPLPSSLETPEGEWLGDKVAARARPQHISRSPRFILA